MQELGKLGCVVEYKNDSYRLNGLNTIPQVRSPSLAFSALFALSGLRPLLGFLAVS